MRRNAYLIIEGCTALRNHLDLKRMLTIDEDLRREYAALKSELVEREWNNIGEYSSAKTEVICKVLEKAGWSEIELERVRSVNS